jgi:hypothetical protein
MLTCPFFQDLSQFNNFYTGCQIGVLNMPDAQYQFHVLMPGEYTLIAQRKTEHGLNLKHHRSIARLQELILLYKKH